MKACPLSLGCANTIARLFHTNPISISKCIIIVLKITDQAWNFKKDMNPVTFLNVAHGVIKGAAMQAACATVFKTKSLVKLKSEDNDMDNLLTRWGLEMHVHVTAVNSIPALVNFCNYQCVKHRGIRMLDAMQFLRTQKSTFFMIAIGRACSADSSIRLLQTYCVACLQMQLGHDRHGFTVTATIS